MTDSATDWGVIIVANECLYRGNVLDEKEINCITKLEKKNQNIKPPVVNPLPFLHSIKM